MFSAAVAHAASQASADEATKLKEQKLQQLRSLERMRQKLEGELTELDPAAVEDHIT
jgi:hypothetical protein